MSRDHYHHGDLARAARAEVEAIVRRHGADKVSMRAVARTLEVDVAAIYRHYRDKATLMRAVAADGFRALRAHMDAAAVGPAEAGLQAVGRAYVAFALAEPHWFRLMFGPWGAGGGEDLGLSEAESAWVPLVERLEALKAAGRCALPVAAATTAAWSAVHGLATLALDGPLERERAETELDAVLAVVVRGVGDADQLP